MEAETRALWEELFKDISRFDDFRLCKAERGGNASDFRHKESGKGLWWVTGEAWSWEQIPLLRLIHAYYILEILGFQSGRHWDFEETVSFRSQCMEVELTLLPHI